MNILFIIGNGFDINLGMNTRYRDFYNYYQPKASSSKKIKELKNSILNDVNYWSDLEKTLGEYTKKLESASVFDEVFDDIQDNLAEYLQQIESAFDYSKIKKEKLIQYLSSPWFSLPNDDKNSIYAYRNRWSSSSGLHVNIITFNYTRSLEKILGYFGKNISYSPSFSLNKIEHIHGYTDERMILGVNDISQIANSGFHQDQDILDIFVKSHCNRASKYGVESSCKEFVSNANLICIFGSSIGDTDNIWWELVGERLKKAGGDCKLILFIKCGTIHPIKEPRKEAIRRKEKEFFLDKTKLSAEEKSIIDNNVFIGVNTGIFDFS